MQLLLVRHGKAETPEAAATAGRNEATRQLTDDGRKEMRRAAQALKRLLDVDVIASSPLTRAQQTADMIGKAFCIKTEILSALVPGLDRAELLRWLSAQADNATCAIIGHEPDFSALAAWFVCGDPRAAIEMKKGAALLLAFRAEPAAGEAELRWLLPPKVLRRMRDE